MANRETAPLARLRCGEAYAEVRAESLSCRGSERARAGLLPRERSQPGPLPDLAPFGDCR
jgi:hypothetical protein